MLFKMHWVLLLGVLAFATAVAAQSTPPPSGITRTVIAATKLLTVTEVPLQSGERYPSTGRKDHLIGIQWH
jgi:hypothetical protein